MNTNYKQSDKDGRKKNLREGLPAYAYSRGVELRSDNSSLHAQSEMYGSGRNVLNISYPINVGEFELPNEDQISYYEQLMMRSNESIILNNFLENRESQPFTQVITKKPISVPSKILLKNTSSSSSSSNTLPFYKICFEIIKEPINDTKWKLCVIAEHSTEIRHEIQQIYLHMWLYYENYMQKVDLGVLDNCNRIMGFGQAVTETERFHLTIREDYLMATQIFTLLRHALANQQHMSIFKQMMETLEMWKHLAEKMNTNPKLYKLSLSYTSSDMTELLEYLIRNYFKIRHYFEVCFILMTNKENAVKKQQVKDDMLCKYWYSMLTSPPQNFVL